MVHLLISVTGNKIVTGAGGSWLRFGLKQISIFDCTEACYSESNMLGSGLKEEDDGGLTYFGRQAVDRMNKIGMAIDIAHTGDKTSLDTIKASRKPVFIPHAGARGVWNSKRMRPDEVIKACADSGGVIGIEAAPHTTVSRKNPQMNIESVMDHFEYCVNLVGIDRLFQQG